MTAGAPIAASGAAVVGSSARGDALSSNTTSSLPIDLDDLFGRERDLGALQQLLSTTSLLTLIGPAGVGKSRLARHAARLLQAQAQIPVYAMDLEAIDTPGTLASGLVQLLGMDASIQRMSFDQLARELIGRRLLLVLDNCDAAGALVADLATIVTSRCPEVSLCATSRQRLDVLGEVVYQVHALTIPAVESSFASLAASASVQLFVARAAEANRDFFLDETNSADIARICIELEGLPLAIELAASRTCILSARQILERLDVAVRLPEVGARRRGPPSPRYAIRA